MKSDGRGMLLTGLLGVDAFTKISALFIVGDWLQSVSSDEDSLLNVLGGDFDVPLGTEWLNDVMIGLMERQKLTVVCTVLLNRGNVAIKDDF